MALQSAFQGIAGVGVSEFPGFPDCPVEVSPERLQYARTGRPAASTRSRAAARAAVKPVRDIRLKSRALASMTGAARSFGRTTESGPGLRLRQSIRPRKPSYGGTGRNATFSDARSLRAALAPKLENRGRAAPAPAPAHRWIGASGQGLRCRRHGRPAVPALDAT